jgi:hypothetical protein
MPLIKENELAKESEEWFPLECRRDRTYHAEENAWSSRHVALFVNDWIGRGTKDHDWAKRGTSSTPAVQCGQMVYESPTGEHLKVQPGFKEVVFSLYEEKDYRILALKVKAEELCFEFETLTKRWQRDTRHVSLISKKVAHPAYLRIVGMGEAAIPLLLEALRDRPDHWFAALRAIANVDPCPIDANPSQAREAWLSWGRSHGYID